MIVLLAAVLLAQPKPVPVPDQQKKKDGDDGDDADGDVPCSTGIAGGRNDRRFLRRALERSKDRVTTGMNSQSS